MSWIADAHRDWHTVNGPKEETVGLCPLDCYDPPYDPEDYMEQDVFYPAVVEGPPEPLF